MSRNQMVFPIALVIGTFLCGQLTAALAADKCADTYEICVGKCYQLPRGEGADSPAAEKFKECLINCEQEAGRCARGG